MSYDLSKEKNVGFLKHANQWLQEELLRTQKKLAEVTLQQQLDEEISRSLSDQLNVLRQRFFDKKREKLDSKQNGKKKRTGNLPHNQSPIKLSANPKLSLDEEKVEHNLDNLTCNCGDSNCQLVALPNCFEESSEIDVVVHRYKIKKHLRQKYKGTCCGRMVTAPGPTKLVTGGKFSIEMAVEIAYNKFNNYLPLERQRKEMAHRGLEVEVKTLYNLTVYAYELLKDLPEKIRKEILSRPWVHIDESPHIFFNKEKAKGYIWTLSNNYGCYYNFEPTRAAAIAKEMLKDYRGNVITDGYSGYEWLEKEEGIIHALCWAHVRRYFFEAIKSYPISKEVVVLIDKLYAVEDESRDFEHLRVLRAEKSKPITNEIEKWINGIQGKYLESSALGKAVKYYLKRKSKLHLFLDDPYIPLDNNTAERSQKAAVMGRKNYLFFKSIDGGDIASLFFTLIESCKKFAIDPRTYLLAMSLKSAKGEKLETPYVYAQRMEAIAQKNFEEIMSRCPSPE